MYNIQDSCWGVKEAAIGGGAGVGVGDHGNHETVFGIRCTCRMQKKQEIPSLDSASKWKSHNCAGFAPFRPAILAHRTATEH